MSKQETLILGAAGKTGSRVAHRLDARGVPVRIGHEVRYTPRAGAWNGRGLAP